VSPNQVSHACGAVALVTWSERVVRDVSRLDIRDTIAGIAGTNAWGARVRVLRFTRGRVAAAAGSRQTLADALSLIVRLPAPLRPYEAPTKAMWQATTAKMRLDASQSLHFALRYHQARPRSSLACEECDVPLPKPFGAAILAAKPFGDW
jgi:hypothetical protein